MNEKRRRIEAIRRVAQGESVTKVCADLNRSRGWYYKWQARLEKEGVAGLSGQRGQHEPANKTPAWLQELIIATRDRLVAQAEQGQTFRGIGARVVAQELSALDIEAPHWTTIHRILRAANRVPQPQAQGTENDCPEPQADRLNGLHQVDIWPAYLQGGERIYFFHLVDVASWYPHGQVASHKNTDSALSFLVESWQIVGLPEIVQFDNEMTFTGGRWAHRLGRVVRLCLALGVQVWFIPFYEPQRNGYVEAFHGEVDRFLWSRYQFESRTEVLEPYAAFLNYFRHERHLPAIDDLTPAQRRTELGRSIRYLPDPWTGLDQAQLPLVAGRIYCVRLVDAQGHLNILNHSLKLDPAYARHYLLARIDTAQQQLSLFHQADAAAEPECIHTEPFPLDEPVLDFRPDFDYPTVAG